jgi:hypothetical protein
MAFYEITVRGALGPRVTAALGDLPVETRGSVTMLRGELGSEALSDVLSRIRDLRLELIDVRLVATSGSTGPAA